MSAFGQVGPLAERPGLDPVVQSYGGLAWEQGAAGEAPPELVRGQPRRRYYTASLAVSGILLALVARAPDWEQGQRIDTSLLDGVLAIQAGRAFWAQAQSRRMRSGTLLGRPGVADLPHARRASRASTWSCRSSGRDCAGRSGWRAGSTILASGPWSDATRTRRRLIGTITERLAAPDGHGVGGALRRGGRAVHAGPLGARGCSWIPQALLNGTLATVEHPTLGPVRLLGVPVRLAATPAPPGPPPAVGEHTDVILAEAGLSAAEIARLRGAGVVR